MNQPHILVVDDSKFLRKAMQRELERLGAKVALAEDGEQGFVYACQHAHSLDLVISDVDMPHMDGFTLCRKLKESADTSSLPIVICSSRDSEQAIEMGFKAGADGYIPKTNGRTDFLQQVQHILERTNIVKNKRVLVVDDALFIRNSLKDELRAEGFEVYTASNGQEALEFLHGKDAPRIHIIVSDIEMPVMNGLDFLIAIKHSALLKNIPFLVMTSNSEERVIHRIFQAGAASYLAKPFNSTHLIHTIKKLLSDQFLQLLREKERLEGERNLLLGSITSLIQALEARDHYTRGHSTEVARIVSKMANELGLDADTREKLNIAASLHDLGKIGIPDHILLKPGKLTDEEFSIIKQHPTIGADILRPIPSMSDLIPAVLSHHEHMDGTGYPQGLKGQEIPLFGRIIAVADVYHALTSDRPYRKGMPHEKAIAIILEEKGSHLCPECVDAFLKAWRSQS